MYPALDSSLNQSPQPCTPLPEEARQYSTSSNGLTQRLSSMVKWEVPFFSGLPGIVSLSDKLRHRTMYSFVLRVHMRLAHNHFCWMGSCQLVNSSFSNSCPQPPGNPWPYLHSLIHSPAMHSAQLLLHVRHARITTERSCSRQQPDTLVPIRTWPREAEIKSHQE